MRRPLTSRRPGGPRSGCRGLTLVELMVSMTIGLLLTAALSLIFLNNSRTRVETEKTHAQIENGRFATQLLSDDFQLAGYYGEFDPTPLTTPAAVPDPSLTDAASLKAAMALPVQGFDNATSLTAGLPSAVSADFRDGTDVLVIRRASTCVAGTGDCDALDTGRNTYFQTALCVQQLAGLTSENQVLISTTASQFTTSNPALTSTSPGFLAAKNCTGAATIRSYFVRIYYIANNNQPGDGIPTLKVAELGADAWTLSALVEGIEQLQVEYGLDTGGSDQGAPDSFVTLPASAAAWRQVTTLRVGLLARNTEASAGYTDTRSYVLGKTLDVSGNSIDNLFGPFNDGFRRHVYTSTIRLINVAGRLE